MDPFVAAVPRDLVQPCPKNKQKDIYQAQVSAFNAEKVNLIQFLHMIFNNIKKNVE
jgi:hypothetical protein